MGHTTTELRQAEELLGAMFTTPKDLRHLAEQTLGHLFIPTEVVHQDETTANLVLRPADLGAIHVHGERERDWYPFQITRVDVVGD